MVGPQIEDGYEVAELTDTSRTEALNGGAKAVVPRAITPHGRRLDRVERAREETRIPARRRLRRFPLLLDALAILLGFALGVVLHNLIATGASDRLSWLWVFAAVPVQLVAFWVYGLYSRDRRRLFSTNFPDHVHLFHAVVAGAFGTFGVSHLVSALAGGPALSPGAVFGIAAPVFLTVPFTRAASGELARRRGHIRSRVIILGTGYVSDTVARRLQAFDDVELLGCVDDPGGPAPERHSLLPVLGKVSDLPRLCDELGADRVMVAFSPASTNALAETLRHLAPGVRISVVPRLFDLLTWRSHIDDIHGLPVMDVAPPVLGAGPRAIKRLLDVAVSLSLLGLLAPLWLAIAFVIRASSPGPVLFRQQRRGRDGRPFSIYKFRTMRVGADDEKRDMMDANEVDGPLFKIKDDPRVFGIGRFLRATSLDEAPQLINVLKGDMSLVGPRPFVVSEADMIDGWAARRFDVRPGMTGLWQVSGRNDLPYEELRRLDYTYVASWSLWWDLRIILQTPACLLRRRGAY